LLAARIDPATAYGNGLAAYWAGDYHRAREYFEAAVTPGGRDARPWYYLALTSWAIGDEAAAREAARYGAAVALNYPDDNADLPSALERVQGNSRRWLSGATAEVATAASARAVLERGPQLPRLQAAVRTEPPPDR
jgi:hypothetical protein